MRRINVYLLAIMVAAGGTLSGCATAESKWESAAIGAALIDIGSTGGALRQEGYKEANPIFGEQPSVGKMAAINLGAYTGIWALTRKLDPVEKQKMWRNVAILRLLVAGWNLSQNGISFSIKF